MFSHFSKVLKGEHTIDNRPGETLPEFDFDSHKAELVAQHGKRIKDTDVMSSALYPKVFEDFANFKKDFGPVHCLDTKIFLVGPNIAEEFNVRLSVIITDSFSV